MSIKVRPIGLIKRFAQEQEIDLREGLTPRQLIRDLGIPEELRMMAFVNGKSRGLDEELRNGDDIKLVTLLTGG